MVQPRKTRIIRLIDELLKQFHKDKFIFAQLIRHRHVVRNALSDETIDAEVSLFEKLNRDRLAIRDTSVFESSPIAKDVKTVWDSLDQRNREVFWKWINFILH